MGDLLEFFRIFNWEILKFMKTIEVQNKLTIAKNGTETEEELSLAMILHEIRTPMTTILLALSHLEKISLPAQSQRQITLALREAQRLRVLLNDRLVGSRSSPPQLEVIELNNFILQTQELIQALPVTKNRQLLWSSTPEPVWIQGDRHQLIQVLINLVTNACQAVEPGSVVSCVLDLDDRCEQVSIRFHNDGDPIEPEILSHLTEPLFTTKVNGTGLGLAIVNRIVDAHSGQLTIKSNLEGTTVSVCLPLFSR